MTDGTSQGLFIVVAIVIFGIFVSLSYTVFGSMGNGLDGLVDNATLQAENRLETNQNLLLSTDVVTHYLTLETNTGRRVKGTYNSYNVGTGAAGYVALHIREHTDYYAGGTYKVSGYLHINGLPATEEQWTDNRHNTMNSHPIETHIDSETGYFEFTYVQDGVGSDGARVLHPRLRNENGDWLEIGDTVEFTRLKLTSLN